MKKAKNFVFGILGILFFLNLLAWLTVYDLSQPQFLEVTFFDVGQGDAIFIETPQRHQILIDGGPSSVILEKLGKEIPFWDRTIDLVVLTHPEHDHLAGLIEVLKRYKVNLILWTGVVRNTSEYKEWLKSIENENAKIKIAQTGQKISCLTPGVKQCYFEVLYPLENLEGQEVKNSNNTSIVAKLVFKENSFLFTGDAYKSVERKLGDGGVDLDYNPPTTRQGINIDSDVLKVGHHGSKTSSSEEFLKQVSPEIAVIPVGENRYGHPHQEVLARLEKFGIKVLRTDENGDIKIISNGKKLWSNQKRKKL